MIVWLELSWEQPGEPRFQVIFRLPSEDKIAAPFKMMTRLPMMVHEACEVADHCGRSMDGDVEIEVRDTTLGQTSHVYRFRNRMPVG
jgi:hypothetical protein